MILALVLGGSVMSGCAGDSSSGTSDAEDGAVADGPSRDADVGVDPMDRDAAPDDDMDAALDASGPPDDDDDAGTEPPPACPKGQELIDDVCVTPSDSGSPFVCTVPPIVPCGGDLVGSWAYVDSCSLTPHSNPYETSCGDMVVIHHVWDEFDGTLQFDANGRYSESYTPTRHSESDFPISCGGYYDCERLGRSWGLGTCVEDSQRCLCSQLEVQSPDSRGDSYTVVGNEVTFLGDSMGSPYCVEGDTLYLNKVDASSYLPLVLTRQ